MQDISRRNLVKSSLTALAVSPLLPLLSVGKPAFGATLPTLSASAVTAAKTAIINLNKKTTARTATATDVQSAATALGVLFGNMHETGYNSAIVGPLRTGIQGMINSGADGSQKARSLLASNGINITSAQAEQLFHLTVPQLQHILSGLSSPGLYSMELTFASNLAAGAKKVESEGIQHVSSPGTSRAHLRTVELDISPCGMDGFVMGGLGFFSPPPVDFLFWAGGMVYSFMAAEGWC